MSRPRENPRKILKKFSAYEIFKKLENPSFRLGTLKVILVENRSLRNRPKVLRGSLWALKDQKVPLEPYRKMSHLSRKKHEKRFFENCVGGKFFENFFLGFPEVYSS